MSEFSPKPPASPKAEGMNSPARAKRGGEAPIPPPRISPELEVLKQRAINGEDLSGCDASLFPELMVALKQQRDFLISFDLYTNSEECDRALKEVTRLNEQYLKQKTQKEMQSEYKQRLSRARKELAELEQKAERLEKNMEVSLQEEMEAVRKRQEKQIEEYNQNWESEKKLRRYNRTSPELRVLRVQAIKLLNSHRYDEMRIVDKQANELEQQEAEASHLLMEFDYANGYVLLQKKHEEEIQKVIASQKRKRAEFNAAKEEDLNVIRQKIRKLENGLESAADQDKVWNGKKRQVMEKTMREVSIPQPQFGVGKKRIDVTQFNTLKLPALGSESPIQKKKKAKLQEKLKVRLSAPVSPRSSPRPNTMERSRTNEVFSSPLRYANHPMSPTSPRRYAMTQRYDRTRSPF